MNNAKDAALNITFTAQKTRELRKAYNRALHTNQNQFAFEGREVLVDYAKYLLEYLESEFGKEAT